MKLTKEQTQEIKDQQTQENKTKRESINADGSHKKKANPNNLDSKSNKSNTQEYSKDDIQKFEKLNTKE